LAEQHTAFSQLLEILLARDEFAVVHPFWPSCSCHRRR
jgi:hypothetical protein